MTETDKDDLVARLRLGGKVRADGGYSIPREKETMREAADEIERLRLQLARVKLKLENIACDPHARANPHVYHNEWELFAMQLVGHAREALSELTDDIGKTND